MFCFRLFSSCCWGSLRGRPWHLTPTLGLVVTLSATCFPVLSRRTCQTLWRVTLLAIVAITNSLIQNVVSFEILPLFQESWLAQSWLRLMTLEFVCPNVNSLFWTLFRLIPNKMLSGTHSNQFETVPLVVKLVRLLVFRPWEPLCRAPVYRPSFTSILPEIRPGWSTDLQETEEPTCWMCSIQTHGIGTLSCKDKPTLFLS